MKDIFKYGLIAGGVYLLWPHLSGLFGGMAPAPPAAASGGATSSTPTHDTAQPTQVSVRSELLRLAGGETQLSEDQWCYYWAIVKKGPCPDPLLIFPGRDRATPMSVDEFLAGTTAYGMAGFGWGTF